MWLLYRVFILTAFLISAGQALAQQQNVVPAPPASTLVEQPQQMPPQMPQPMPMMAPQVIPAPTLPPMLSPSDQAAANNRAIAEQQAAQQAAQQQNQQMPQQQQVILEPQQSPQPQQGMPIQTQAQPITTAPADIPLTSAEPAAATAPTPGLVPLPTTTTSPKPTNTQGFAPATTAGTIPTTTGMMPITNAGIDMGLSPNMVGGIDLQPGTPIEQLPYEVQLQQRTQELQEQARGMAFEQAKKSALPMEPYEIRDVLSRLKDTQEAIQTPVRPAPKPGNVVKTISTDPGVKPQTIHLAANNVTTINIIDVTGEPWPIVDIGFGGPFEVKPPEAGGHVIRIAPRKDFARGNLVIRLLKMTTPITFSLESGGETVDYRFDARIPELGPNAKTPVIDEGIGLMAGDKVTTSFLEGVPPTGAEKIIVDGTDGRTSAYRFSSALYLRTPLSLLSPAWRGSATSSDGMNVYVLEDTPVVLLSDKGSLVRAHLGQKSRTSSSISSKE